VLRIRERLSQLGVRTALPEAPTTLWGRAWTSAPRWPNALHPDAIVSIHADGGPPEGRGFHVNYANPPLNDAQAGPAIRFAQTVRDQLFASGVQPSTYRATDGLYGRADLAGLNLAQYPSIVIELKNAEEAAVLSASA
jgi:N-acetylmuramoyl-L-alanine amidase